MSKIKKKVIKINFILALISIVFMALLSFSGYSINIIHNFESNLRTDIEQQKRSDARILLKDVTDRFDYAIKSNQVNPSDINSVSNWANHNFVGLRNGSLDSDGFIIELVTEQYISDSDTTYTALISNKKTISSDIKDQANKILAKEAYRRIKLGINSVYGDNIFWNQNGSTQWLEWEVYPTAISVGVNDEPKTIYGIKNSHYRKYVFVLRTDENETFKPYESEFNTLSFIINLIYVLLCLALVFIAFIMFYIVYLEFHRCNDDRKNKT